MLPSEIIEFLGKTTLLLNQFRYYGLKGLGLLLLCLYNYL
jgi:hypothetical protein